MKTRKKCCEPVQDQTASPIGHLVTDKRVQSAPSFSHNGESSLASERVIQTYTGLPNQRGSRPTNKWSTEQPAAFFPMCGRLSAGAREARTHSQQGEGTALRMAIMA